MKELFEMFYIYDREVIEETRESWVKVRDAYVDAVRNTMAMLFMYEREVIDEVEEKAAEVICGKHI